jgi:glycosyltransferase involved in cell wall biosynthesis
MKILIVNTFDTGGAGIACLRLHKALLKRGVDSKVILVRKQKQKEKTYLIQPKKKSLFQKIKKGIYKTLIEFHILKKKTSKEEMFIKNRSSKLEMFSYPFSDYDITDNEWYREADIINLHWVANMLDFKSFFETNTKPVVWTLHDMNPFTGGEHYLETIIDIDNNGQPIMRKKGEVEQKVEDYYFKFKREIFKKVKNLTIVTPSKWLSNEALKSSFFSKKKIFHIPNGLDKNIYKIRDKAFSREILNLPKDKKVVLFVAESINNNNRKGFVYLRRVFEELSDSDVVLCAVGSKKASIKSLNNLIELGPIHDEKMMSLAYSAADVFVIPSLMDNLPNTVIESLMCGTPVIGFPVGGIVEMVQNEINGYIALDISVKSLKDVLWKFLNDEVIFNSTEIRSKTIEKYDLMVQANQYINLYNNLLSQI